MSDAGQPPEDGPGRGVSQITTYVYNTAGELSHAILPGGETVPIPPSSEERPTERAYTVFQWDAEAQQWRRL